MVWLGLVAGGVLGVAAVVRLWRWARAREAHAAAMRSASYLSDVARGAVVVPAAGALDRAVERLSEQVDALSRSTPPGEEAADDDGDWEEGETPLGWNEPPPSE